MSKIVPNTTQVPNLHIDKLMVLLEDSELRTLLYAVRRTMGFHKQSDRIALSQFMEGNKAVGEDGEYLEYGTGLSKSTQIKALDNLVHFGLLLLVDEGSGQTSAEWALQLDDRAIEWDAMWDRYERKKKRGARRTAAGRRAAAESRGETDGISGSTIRPLNEPISGSTIEPLAVQPLDRKPPLAVQPLNPQKKDLRKPVRKPDSGAQKVGTEGDEGLELTYGRLVQVCGGDRDAAAAVWQLQQAFCEQSRLPRPDIDTPSGRDELARDWWPYLLAVLQAAGGELGQAQAAMTGAITEMHQWRPTSVQSPRSVMRKAKAHVAAGIRAPQTISNGHAAGNGRASTGKYGGAV